jgi:hypothetical protein
MYRIVLACTGIPPDEGPPGAQCIKEEFTRRPCHTNVKCEWNGTQLVLQADNDYDSTGLALMDEFLMRYPRVFQTRELEASGSCL